MKRIIVAASMGMLPFSAVANVSDAQSVLSSSQPATIADIQTANMQSRLIRKQLAQHGPTYQNLELRMEMTYTNRTKYIWFNELQQARATIGAVLKQSQELAPKVKHLMTIQEITPAVKLEALALVDEIQSLDSATRVVSENASQMRYWKDRIVKELDSRTFITLDERALIDAIGSDAKTLDVLSAQMLEQAELFLELVNK